MTEQQPSDQSVEEGLTPQQKAAVQEMLAQHEAPRKQIVPYGYGVAGPPVAETDRDKIRDLETELAVLKERLRQLASREDLEKTKNSVLRWMVGTGISATGLLLAVLALL